MPLISAVPVRNGTIADVEQAIEDDSLNANYPYADSGENGEAIPVTMGTVDKAKLIRTESAIIPVQVNGTVPDSGNYDTLFSNPNTETHTEDQYVFRMTSQPDYGDIQDFPAYAVLPVGATTNILTYRIKFATSGSWLLINGSPITTGIILLTALAGKYLVATDGTQKGNGRLIDSASVILSGTNADEYLINVLLAASNYFTDDSGNQLPLKVNATTTPVDGDSWVQIQDIKRTYTADLWPLKAFV